MLQALIDDLPLVFPPRVPVVITSDALAFEAFFGVPADLETPAAGFFGKARPTRAWGDGRKEKECGCTCIGPID